MDLQSQIIILNDGRRLGHADAADQYGKPIVLFVGGSSRLVRPPSSPDVRLITVDRPGIGLSDPHPGRTLLDLPADILQLADALGIGLFSVVGISQGGPSALACAYQIPHRLVAAGVVSSLAPPVAYLRVNLSGPVARFARLANNFPLALRTQSVIAAVMARQAPRWTFEQVMRGLSPADRAIFEANPELVAMFVKDLNETYRQGSKGSFQEGLLAYRPWGFSVGEIQTRVYVWHGENDKSVPAAMGRFLAETLPNCQTTFLKDEGHFLGLKYWPEITAQLLSDA
jgi:pimeloyl-ACP methyl ester carboxylesterase